METQVVRLLSIGKVSKEVAQELGLSTNTVSVYRSRIMMKLGLSSFAELVRYAIQQNIAPLEPPPPDDSIVA
jgi:DNA-binding NarL/FixJ family response regulator